MKKGFIKNNWQQIFIIAITVVMSIQTKDWLIIILTVAFIAAVIMKYRKYDVLEQEANDWWNSLEKDKRIEIKNKGLQ